MPKKSRNARAALINSKEGGKANQQKVLGTKAATVLGKQKALIALCEHEERSAHLKKVLETAVITVAKRPDCRCVQCSSEGASSSRRILAKDHSKGELRFAVNRAAEILAHGLTPAPTAKDAKAQLRALISCNAVYITYVAPEAPARVLETSAAELPGEDPAPPSSPPHQQKRRRSDVPDHIELDITPTATRRTRGQRASDVETREGERFVLHELAQWKEHIPDDPTLAPIWRIGFCAVLEGIVEYDVYKKFEKRRGLKRSLTKHEWDAVIIHTLVLACTLWEEYLNLGAAVAKKAAVYEKMRPHLFPIPHGNSVVLKVDTAWCLPGHNSPQGFTVVLDALTQIALHTVQMTKDNDKDEVSPCMPLLVWSETDCAHLTARCTRFPQVLKRFPSLFITGWAESSGNMDAEGTKVCVGALVAKDPQRFQKVLFVADGDVHRKRWRDIEGTEQWQGGDCDCHKGKNIPKATRGSSMSGITCTCKSNPGGKSCTSMPGYRWKDEWAFRISAWWHRQNAVAVGMYLPEVAQEGMALPNDLGSSERETARLKAVAWRQQEIMGMFYHITGECQASICKHPPLPSDHPRLRCQAQKAHLWAVLSGLAGSSETVLTPLGCLDINVVESFNSVVEKSRRKGKWAFLPCFLAELFGFFQWQRLQLGFWGELRNPRAELAALIKEHLGLDVLYSPEELQKMDADLDAKLSAKEKRSSQAHQELVKAARARRLGYARKGSAVSEYLAGGSAAATAALAEKAPSDWLHGEPAECITELGEFDLEEEEDEGSISGLEQGSVLD